MDRTSYQLGGILLVVAGIGGVVGAVLHGPQPGSLEALAGLGAAWTASHVLIGLAGALFGASAFFLIRHFAGSPGEGWALGGAAFVLLSGVAFLTIGAIETHGFSMLQGAADGNAVAAEHAFLAASSFMASVAAAAGYLFPVAVGALSAGMLKDGAFPGWLGWTGLAVGAFALVLHASATTVFGMPYLPIILLNLWFALGGFYLFGAGRERVPDRIPVTDETPAPGRRERTGTR